MPLDKVYIQCKISRGAFSGERFFEFSLPDGNLYQSVADLFYCMDGNKTKLSKDFPLQDQSINGYLQAYKVLSDNDIAYISIPDGEVVPVENNKIISQECR